MVVVTVLVRTDVVTVMVVDVLAIGKGVPAPTEVPPTEAPPRAAAEEAAVVVVVQVVVATGVAAVVSINEGEAGVVVPPEEELEKTELSSPMLNADCSGGASQVSPTGPHVVPGAQATTLDHAPDAQRWNAVAMQYQAPSRSFSAQDEPTGMAAVGGGVLLLLSLPRRWGRRAVVFGGAIWFFSSKSVVVVIVWEEVGVLVGAPRVAKTEMGRSATVARIGFMVVCCGRGLFFPEQEKDDLSDTVVGFLFLAKFVARCLRTCGLL